MMSERTHFDIFISHASADEIIARKIAEALAQHGISTFEVRDLLPGVEWESRLRDGLEASQDVAIIIGSSPYSDSYVSKEWSRIVEASWERPERRIIPLIRANAEIPPFLQAFQCMKINENDVEETALELVGLLRSEHRLERDVGPGGFRQRVQANERLIKQAVQPRDKVPE